MAKPNWASRIVALRKSLGLLQVEFAQRLLVTQAAVSRWENGSSNPSAENYIRMADLADDINCVWFWKQAGVDVERLARLAAAHNASIRKSSKT